MTTRIHVVNLGPDLVEVKESSSNKSVVLCHGESLNAYVHSTNEVLVTEKPIEKV